jgi:hypothetical protein
MSLAILPYELLHKVTHFLPPHEVPALARVSKGMNAATSDRMCSPDGCFRPPDRGGVAHAVNERWSACRHCPGVDDDPVRLAARISTSERAQLAQQRLILASSKGHVYASMGDGADPRRVDAGGHSVLHTLHHDSHEVAEALITVGKVDVNARATICGCGSALAASLHRGFDNTAAVLLRHGATVDYDAILGAIATHSALLGDVFELAHGTLDARTCVAIVEKLVASDSVGSARVAIPYVGVPAVLESQILSAEMAHVLLANGMHPDALSGGLNLVHIFSGDVAMLAVLHASGANLAAGTAAAGFSALHLAPSGRCVRFLVEMAVPVDHRTARDGRTPLHVHVMHGRSGAVDALLALGANPFARDHHGESAASYIRSRRVGLSKATTGRLFAAMDAWEASGEDVSDYG